MSTPTQPGDPDLVRAGNADRERVVRQLNDAFAEGRLDVAELDERVAAAYAAKTMGELRPLTADLPAAGSLAMPRHPVAGPPGPPVPRQPVEPPAHRLPWPDAAFRGWLGVVAVNVVIWAVVSISTGQLIYFWPIWVAIPLVLMVVRHIAGPDPRRRYRDERRRDG